MIFVGNFVDDDGALLSVADVRGELSVHGLTQLGAATFSQIHSLLLSVCCTIRYCIQSKFATITGSWQ